MRQAFLLLSLCLAVLPRADAAGETWPARPIRLVVGAPAGSGMDFTMRTLAERLHAELGQPVIVDNRPGADGIIAARQVAASPPDGYTLLPATPAQMTINPLLRDDLQYDPARDFVPVSMISQVPLVLVVNPAVPASSVRELAAWSRTHPAALNYGSGSSTFLFATEELKRITGADLVHVPYNGIPPVVNALLAGDVQVALVNIPPAIGHLRSGALRALAVTGAAREPLLADVPTLAEAGYPGFGFVVWTGMFAPAGTPPDVVARLHAAIARGLEAPDVRARLLASGIVPVSSTPQALGDAIRRDLNGLGHAAKAARIGAK